VAAREHFIHMRGGEVFRSAVRWMTQACQEALAKANLRLEDVHAVVPHQANERIITAVRQALGVPAGKVLVNVDRYGNTGATSVGIALAELLARAEPRPGDNLLFVSFGGGLTWAASVVRWADVAAIRQNERLLRDRAAETAALPRALRGLRGPHSVIPS
jgi:3-oxoacyl-[acyl-carrier-protein] synthase-3